MKKKIVGIIGLGYVGLPLTILLNKKFNTIGFDTDKNKIKYILKNKSYISDIKNKEIKLIKNKEFYFKFNKKNIGKCDVIIICLPTPLANDKPDLSYIITAFENIYNFLRPNQLIILESTVYPGATKKIFEKKLKKKFNLGNNFYLGYSPERINPGSKKIKTNNYSYQSITKLVSGYSKTCRLKTNQIYSKVFKKTFECKDIETAETSKLYENIFRSVNIALVNNFKMFCYKFDLNVHDILDAADTKGFGFKKFLPGPGIGGHCIPIDPIFLEWFAKKKNFSTKFISLAKKVNIDTTNWILKHVTKNIFKNKKEKILVLGAAYKKNIDDIRESPFLHIANKIIKLKKLELFYHDPYVKSVKIKNTILCSINYKHIFKKRFEKILILTDHDFYPWKKISQITRSKIYDTRGVLKNYTKKNIFHL